jgi:hypothetical protein
MASSTRTRRSAQARKMHTKKLRPHAQAALVPPMTSGEFERFKQDMQARGIQDAIHVTDRFVVLDGTTGFARLVSCA